MMLVPGCRIAQWLVGSGEAETFNQQRRCTGHTNMSPDVRLHLVSDCLEVLSALVNTWCGYQFLGL